jgi:hypothetical protein
MPNTRRSAQLEPMDVENPAAVSNRNRTALVSQSLFEPFVRTFKRIFQDMASLLASVPSTSIGYRCILDMYMFYYFILRSNAH